MTEGNAATMISALRDFFDKMYPPVYYQITDYVSSGEVMRMDLEFTEHDLFLMSGDTLQSLRELHPNLRLVEFDFRKHMEENRQRMLIPVHPEPYTPEYPAMSAFGVYPRYGRLVGMKRNDM